MLRLEPWPCGFHHSLVHKPDTFEYFNRTLAMIINVPPDQRSYVMPGSTLSETWKQSVRWLIGSYEKGTAFYNKLRRV